MNENLLNQEEEGGGGGLQEQTLVFVYRKYSVVQMLHYLFTVVDYFQLLLDKK